MGTFNRGGFGDRKSGRDFGSSRSGGSSFGRDRGEKQLYKATCSDCGRSCEVPFKPTGSKSVLCNDCFGGQGGPAFGRDNRDSGRNYDKSRFDKKTFDAVCDKCGNDCEVPFRPTPGKPVLCSMCFAKGGDMKSDFRSESKSNSCCNCDCKENFSILNAKLDRILKNMDICAASKMPKTDLFDPMKDLLDEEEPKKVKKEKAVKVVKKAVVKEVVIPKKKAATKKTK